MSGGNPIDPSRPDGSLPVFGRRLLSSRDALDAALDTLEATGESEGNAAGEPKSIVGNFRRDWRVTEARETTFRDFVSNRTHDGNLGFRDLLKIHFGIYVRHRRYPANPSANGPQFADSSLNGDNRLPPPGEMFLVRLVDVIKLRRVLRDARDHAETGDPEGLREFPVPIPDPDDSRPVDPLVSEIDSWIGSRGSGGQEQARRYLAGFIIKALSSDAARPFQPVWATRLQEFTRACKPSPALIDAGNRAACQAVIAATTPERWLEILGIPGSQRPSWWLVLCYPAGRAVPLFRPTVLDLDDNPWHFPSPRQAGLQGHPVDLGVNRAGAATVPLVPEFIHAQTEHAPADYVALGRCAAVPRIDVASARAEHLSRLQTAYLQATW